MSTVGAVTDLDAVAFVVVLGRALRAAGVPAGPDGEDASAQGTDTDALLRAAASTIEVLRHKDVSALDPAEREELRRALAALDLPGEPRVSRRWRQSPAGGAVDPRRTIRAMLRS